MPLNLNHVTLAGHLTRDPEVKNLSGQKTVAVFGLAANRRWKTPEGEQKEEVTFVDCEAWGRTAELIGQYLAKGSPAYVEGRLKTDAWEDKEGHKRSRLKLVVDSVQFLGTPKSRAEGRGHEDPVDAEPAAAAPAPAQRAARSARIEPGDEPPF
jgi:single-strand DNA-binding protein